MTELAESTEVIESVQADDGTKVEVIQYSNLEGSSDIRTAENLYYASQSGMHLKMVRIILNDSHIRIEPGALYFMKGKLEMQTSTGGGIMKGLARKIASGESFFINEIHGTGEVYLEPTFGHFFLHKISADEGGVIADKGMFYAGTSSLEVSAARQRQASAALWGGEGFIQTRIAGVGIAVLYSPVPQSEVLRYTLNDEKLSVDGNFALMRSEAIEFKAEKSSKSWLTSAVSGEGLLQTFSGTGHVWIAPTQGVYEKLSRPEGLSRLAMPPGSSGTQTKTSK